MKLQQESADGQRITSRGEGWIEVNGERHEGSVMVGMDFCQTVAGDIAGVGELTRAHPVAKKMIDDSPSLILIGTGESFKMAPTAFVGACAGAGIGVESMDTPAACRTFNVLAGEGREVIALIFH